MAEVICRICLRTDLKTRSIAETLIDFHDEITEYAIYANTSPALKYCSLCEHLLRKFYNFSRKCRKANKILKTVKREKNKMFPTNLYEQLPPISLETCEPFSMKLFNLDGEILVPIMLLNEEPNEGKHIGPNDDSLAPVIPIKEETIEIKHIDLDEDSLEQIKEEPLEIIDFDLYSENIDTLEIDDAQDNFVQTDESDNIYGIKINNEADVINAITVAKSSKKQVFEKMDETKEVPVDGLSFTCSDEDSDFQVSDLDEDSDTEMIKEFDKKILSAKALIKLTKTEKKRKLNEEKKLDFRIRWKPWKELEKIEKVFDVTVFDTEEDAKKEMQLRKTSEPYIYAEHKCDICYAVFKYAKLLEYHKRCHSPSAGDHECSICFMRFRTAHTVTRHQYSSHYAKFQCKMCPLVTYIRNVANNHSEKHAGVIHSCDMCDRTFHHIQTYRTHLQMRHQTKHVCVTCARTFVSERGLMSHRNMMHHTKSKEDSEATAHCKLCNLMFINQEVYNLHIMNTETHKSLAKHIIACKVCGASFENSGELKAHKRSQHPSRNTPNDIRFTDGKPMDSCSKCGDTGVGYAWLYHHYKKVHPESSFYAEKAHRRKFMCHICGKCFTVLQHLQNHMKTHTNETRPKRQTNEEQQCLANGECPHCGKKFASALKLKIHMRIHIQDRRYKCELCNKDFLHSWALRAHVRGVHNKIKRIRKPLTEKF